MILTAVTPRLPASAQAAPARLTVHVADGSGKPIALARATIYGPRNLIAESTANGEAVFSSIPSGRYILHVDRFGFDSANVGAVVVESGQDLTVSVRMARAGLKQIASVTVKARPRPSPDSMKISGTQSQLSDSLTSALSSLPGITVDPNGQVSVRGAPPVQTSIEINGVPVSVPGTASDIALFNADVFADASVKPSLGGGGTIGFRTVSPSLAWQGTLRAIASANHGEDVALQEAGTIGDIGISYSHARNIVPDPLDGESFLDSSGLFYAHNASPVVDGDALQLRYEFSPSNTILGTAVFLDSNIPMVCREWTGPVPCGYGPLNMRREALQTFQLKDSAQIGQATADLTLYANRSRSDVDQSGFFVAGLSEPSRSLAESHQSGIIGNINIPVNQRLTIPFSFSATTSTTTSTGNAFGPIVPPFFSQYSSLYGSTVLPLLQTDRVSVGAQLSLRSNTTSLGRDSRFGGALKFGYQPTSHDSLAISFSPGNLGGPVAAFNGVSAPELLHFICSSGIAVGTGPSAAGQSATQTSTSLSWSHGALRWGSQVELYHNIQFNAPISATTNALALPSDLFAPDYLSRAQRAQRDACGPVTPLQLPNLFYQVSGTADRAIYDGAALSLAADLGPQISLGASYSVTLARAYGANPLLFGSNSTVVNGKQLPQVPMHSANLSLRSAISSRAVGLFQVSYQSANNSFNLPAHTTFDAGALIQMPRGLLSVTMTNITNAYAGPFATTANAVPLFTQSGLVPTIAQPLPPRTLRVGYRFHIGLPEREATFSLPTEQFERPPLGFVLLARSLPLERGAPKDPFGINRQSILCGPKDIAPAKAVLDTWARYAQSIEDARAAAAAYPDAFPPLIDGAVEFHYQKNGTSYVILVTPLNGNIPDFAKQFQPVQFCAIVHGPKESDIAARHLFEYPSTLDLTHFLPIYAPEVGLYQQPLRFTMPTSGVAKLPTPENLHYSGPEPTPPSNQPFALKNWSYCSSELRPAAQEVLASIADYAHRYYDLHEKPASPNGLLITQHTETSGKTWLEIRTEDLTSLQNLNQCMFVTVRSHASLQRAGLDGVARPELNYAPLLGLYQAL